MRKGFTLIELLVVIAIIAILAAILFPVFQQARSTAKMAKCAAHGKELGTAMLLYMDDHNGRFPATLSDAEQNQPICTYNWIASGNWSNFTTKEWSYRFSYFQKYVKNAAIWVCPDPTNALARRYAYGYKQSWLLHCSDMDYDNGRVDVGLCYPANDKINPADASGRRCGKTVGAVEMEARRPATRKIVWRCACWGVDEWNGLQEWRPLFPTKPHKEGSIYVYLDGHAKYAKMGRTWAPEKY